MTDFEEAARLVDAARGAGWYDRAGNPADIALARLCLLRRAMSVATRSNEGGDGAVRDALALADPEAVIWLASRVVSYMDEQGFPDFVPRPRPAE